MQCSPISTTGPIFGMAIRASGAHSHWSGKVRHVKACPSLVEADSNRSPFGASMTNSQAASIVGEFELRWRDMLIDLYTPYWTDKTPIEQRRINGPQ